MPLLDNPDPDVKEFAIATVTAYDWTTEDDSDPVAAEAAASAASKVDEELLCSCECYQAASATSAYCKVLKDKFR